MQHCVKETLQNHAFKKIENWMLHISVLPAFVISSKLFTVFMLHRHIYTRFKNILIYD